MIAVVLSLILSATQALPEVQSAETPPATAQETTPPQPPLQERPPDAVERPPATLREPPPPSNTRRQPPQPDERGRSPCFSRSYADANPDDCAGLDRRTASDEAASQATTPNPTPPTLNAPAPGPKIAPPPVAEARTSSSRVAPDQKPTTSAQTSEGARPSLVLIAAGAVAALLVLAAAAWILRHLRRRSVTDTGLRSVELAGPETLILSPNQLARGARGPGKSRWTVRDGRLVLTGPAGTLLNGVPLDRAGDIASTGDTARLGGAEYRVRII